MKSKRFSVEQIVSAIKQHEAGLSIADCRGKSRPLNQSARLDMSHYR